MDKDELLKRLSDIEWDDFEIKEAKDKLPSSVWETVSAFSNTSGGWVVFGVQQNGSTFSVCGVNSAEKIESDFLNTLRNGQKFNCRIHPKAKKYNFEDKIVLAFFIPSSQTKPVYFGNTVNTFIRSGSGDRRANDIEIAAMMRDQAFGSKSEQIVVGTSLDDLNTSSLDSYRSHLRVFNAELPFNTFDDARFCRRTGIMIGNELTYGGLLMFGKGDVVREHIPNFWIDYLEIPGTDYNDAPIRYTYRMAELDNIWDCYNVIFQRLRLFADNPYSPRPDGFAPDDNKQLYSLREGLVNLCSHSDYFAAAHPTIRVFIDKIVFQNPGRFVIDPNDKTQRMQSVPRNPTIIRLFRHAKLSENGGYGIDKMLEWKQQTGMEVIFKSDLLLATVTFQRYIGGNVGGNVGGNATAEGSENKEDTTKTHNKVGGNDGNNNRDFLIRLTSVKKRIVAIIWVTPNITVNNISRQLEMSKRSVERELRDLTQMGIIKREGSTRSGKWLVTVPDGSNSLLQSTDY